jgi:hypothetical protein
VATYSAGMDICKVIETITLYLFTPKNFIQYEKSVFVIRPVGLWPIRICFQPGSNPACLF